VADPSTHSVRSGQTVACPSCGKKIPLTRALRAEIETSLKAEFGERERELRDEFDRKLDADRERVEKDAAKRAEKKLAQELAGLQAQLKDQAKALEDARRVELALRKREQALERQQADLEVTIARALADERAKLVTETEERASEQHRLKDAERERQLGEMRRQIEDLKRKADQGSQQLQGEAGEGELDTTLRSAFPADEINAIGQGVRGADIHHVVVDARGVKRGSILWECKNARHWSDGWIAKLKADQRSLHADVAVLVSASLPKDCRRFTMIDGVLVTDFACAGALAGVIRGNLLELVQARNAALRKNDALELLYRYLSGLEFRQRVEAVVEAFTSMRADLEQERRATERAWARRAKQIDAVTFNVSGMYGDLQGLVPSLPRIGLLELPESDVAVEVR
jgi:hypothetical protein